MNWRFYPLADSLREGVLVDPNGKPAVAYFIPRTRSSIPKWGVGK